MILTKKNGNMNQFDVYTVDLEPSKGAEMKKQRPAVIVSPNAMNKNLNTVLIAPLTHTIKGYPSRVASTFSGQPGEIVLDQIRAVDKIRLKKKIGALDTRTAANIKSVLATMFS
jgi:mRNA interferase MazF